MHYYDTCIFAFQQTGVKCRMLRGESFRNVGEHDVDRNNVDTTAASFTSFNSEEGFGSPAGRRSKGRPNVFEMDDNDLKVHRLWIIIIKCPSNFHKDESEECTEGQHMLWSCQHRLLQHLDCIIL